MGQDVAIEVVGAEQAGQGGFEERAGVGVAFGHQVKQLIGKLGQVEGSGSQGDGPIGEARC